MKERLLLKPSGREGDRESTDGDVAKHRTKITASAERGNNVTEHCAKDTEKLLDDKASFKLYALQCE